MENSQRLIFSTRRKFHLFDKVSDFIVTRLLTARAHRHIADGLPPVAVFAFDFIGRKIAVNGQFEREQLEAIDDFLSPSREQLKHTTALDIGANIGNHSLYLALRFSAVHSFEPSPRTFGVLAVNAMLADNVTIHNYALGDEKGTLCLGSDELNVGEATLLDGENSQHKNMSMVEVKRLDDISEDFGRIGLIKIDVEGFEPMVLRGALKTICLHQPIIIFEQNEEAFVNGRSEAAAILEEAGYVFCVLSKRNSPKSTLGQMIGAIGKIVAGLEFQFHQVKQLEASHYSTIVAVFKDKLEILNSRKKKIR